MEARLRSTGTSGDREEKVLQMNQVKLGDSKAHQGSTARKDIWWLEPALIAVGFTLFIIYGTWRVFENNLYEVDQFLSPFYSPKITLSFWKYSPAMLILWIPGGFRATCYYYRKAYYRSYFMDPPACGVGHHGGESYCGETSFPFILQNLHRYFFYLACIVLAFLWWDAAIAFITPDGKFSVSVLALVMVANCFLLSCYSFGCHAYRHLCGGALDCFTSCSRSKMRFKIWNFVTKLNEHHMMWAWLSLFSVAFTDFYIRQVAAGAMDRIVLF